jgi:hypothetical protein
MKKLDRPAFLLPVDAQLLVDLKVTTRRFRDGWAGSAAGEGIV